MTEKISIYIGNICDWNREDRNRAIYNSMPAMRREKIDRQKNEDDKKRSLVAGYLLSTACAQYGVDIDRYREDSKGKPFFQEEIGEEEAANDRKPIDSLAASEAVNCERDKRSGHLFFGLSHSGSYAVCGCSREYQIGIDLQKKRSISEAMAGKLLCKEEYEGLSQDSEERQKELLSYWTVKESYCKLLGLGLSYGLHNCQIDWENQRVIDKTIGQGRNLVIKQTDSAIDSNPYPVKTNGYPTGYFHLFSPEEGYYGSVCTEGRVEFKEIVICWENF